MSTDINIIKVLIKDNHPKYAKYLLRRFCSEDYRESRGGNPADWPEYQEYWEKVFDRFGWEMNEEFY